MVNLNEVDWSQLPRPEDDGAAAHLTGLALERVSLPATDGSNVDLGALKGEVVLYIYPTTGRPDTPLPDGWDGIPGARGCTPQSCAFRDHYAELKTLGVDHLFGLSTQTTDYQTEAAERMHLPFPLLSDANLAFTSALRPEALSHAIAVGATLATGSTGLLQRGSAIRFEVPWR